MPTPLMKSFAKESGKKPKTVEKLWKKCEKIVKKEYGIDEKSSRFYPLVVGCLKNLLDIKKEKIEEDGEMTTANLGDYVYARKMEPPFARQSMNSDPMRVKSEVKFTKNKLNKKQKKFDHKKVFYALSRRDVYGDGQSLDSVMSEMIEFYSDRIEDINELIEKSIEMTAKYLNINIDEFEIDKE